MKRQLTLLSALALLLSSCDLREPLPVEDPSGAVRLKATLSSFNTPLQGPFTRAEAKSDGRTVYVSCLTAPFEDAIATKSAPVSSVSALGSFGACGLACPLFDEWEKGNLISFFRGACYDWNADRASWESDGDYRWPGGAYKAQIYAWAPYDGVTLENAGVPDEAPVISYAVSTDVAEQVDLLEGIGDSDALVEGFQDFPGDGSKGVAPVSFRHALAGIRIMTRDFGFDAKINEIRLSNIYTRGKTVIGSDAWFDQDSKSHIVVEDVNLDVTVGGDCSSYADSKTIFVIPQVFPEDAQLSISFSTESAIYDEDRVCIYIDLKDIEVRKGYITTFVVSMDENIFYDHMVDYDTENLTFDAFDSDETKTFRIRSCITESNYGLWKAVPWTIDGYSLDGGATWTAEKPNWLDFSATEGTGTGCYPGETVSVTVKKRTPDSEFTNLGPGAESLKRSMLLRKKEEVYSSSTPYNLSYSGSANCYVVEAPGWYSFSLAYGNSLNALKNTNTKAFYSANKRIKINGEDYILKTNFVDSWGAPFTSGSSPYIKVHAQAAGVTLDHAEGGGFFCQVNNISLDLNNNKLYFHIPADGIMEDNLCLRLYDSNGNIAWSWHIWVTGRTLEATTLSNSKKVMNVPLGYNGNLAENTYGSFLASECLVRITNKNGESLEIPITLTESLAVTSEGEPVIPHAVYYQWGRKDPFPALAIGTAYTEPTENTHAEAHRNPFTLYQSSTNMDWYIYPDDTLVDGVLSGENCGMYRWDSDNSYWNIDESLVSAPQNNKVTKTIYDPCPPGWSVPEPNTFAGLSGSDNALFPLMGIYAFDMRADGIPFGFGTDGAYFCSIPTFGSYGGAYYPSGPTLGLSGLNFGKNSWAYPILPAPNNN